MAGPHTDVLCGAAEALKLERSADQGPPGAGVPYLVTDATIAFLTEIKESGKRIVVTDAGSFDVQ